jgi:GAF domain-containing protein
MSMDNTDPNDDARQARGSHGQPIDSGVAREMSELARTLEAESDPKKLMDRIVAAAIADIEGASHAALSLFTKNRVYTDAASDPLVDEVDQAQYEAAEGPCLDASRQARTVRANDLRDEPRWPTFAARAVELGIRSMLSVQLFVEEGGMGALNLYSEHAGAFDDDDENMAMLLGAHASVAMSAARQRQNFDVALDSRDLIGQAKGILMERFKVDSQRAFDMLVYVSQHEHVKLRDLAQTITETGEFDIR